MQDNKQHIYFANCVKSELFLLEKNERYFREEIKTFNWKTFKWEFSHYVWRDKYEMLENSLVEIPDFCFKSIGEVFYYPFIEYSMSDGQKYRQYFLESENATKFYNSISTKYINPHAIDISKTPKYHKV